MMTLGIIPPTLIDQRSMEHHYTVLLGHDDVKFYPPAKRPYPANQAPSVQSPTTPNQ